MLTSPSTIIRSTLDRIDKFFFGPDDTRWDPIRIGAGLGVLLPVLLLGLSGNYERLYGHYGMLPRSEAMDLVYWPGFLFLMKSDPAWVWEIYWATVAAALCLTLGLWTRVAAAVTAFLYVAMIQRNLLSFNGECGVLGFLLPALIFAPTPQRFSFDHLIRKRPLPEKTERWPARWVQINVCMMYLFTTIGKLVGAWDLGTGEIWYQITLCDWFRFQNVEFFHARWFCELAVHGSLLLEGTFAFLVWTRLRLPLVLLLIGLHVLIIVLFGNALFFFNFAAITALCGFLRTSDFKRSRASAHRQVEPATA